MRNEKGIDVQVRVSPKTAFEIRPTITKLLFHLRTDRDVNRRLLGEPYGFWNMFFGDYIPKKSKSGRNKKMGLTQKEILYFFNPDAFKKPPECYKILDYVRNSFLERGIIDQGLLDRFKNLKTARVKLNKHLTELSKNRISSPYGIISKNPKTREYFVIFTHEHSRTFPVLKTVVLRGTESKIVSRNNCSLVYLVDRADLAQRKDFVLNPVGNVARKDEDIKEFVDGIQKLILDETEQLSEKLMNAYISFFKNQYPGDSYSQIAKRLDIEIDPDPKTQIDFKSLVFGASRFGDAMPIILLDPMPGRTGRTTHTNLLENNPSRYPEILSILIDENKITRPAAEALLNTTHCEQILNGTEKVEGALSKEFSNVEEGKKIDKNQVRMIIRRFRGEFKN